MRADRLIAMLMMLQTRGRMTAQVLAEELEVSERTIYRDVNALCFSGIPVVTERGPGGGISLIEKYRSDLTGMTQEEVRVLFMLSIPPALNDLGLGTKLRDALLKITAALPSSLQRDEQQVQQRIHIDPIPWKPPKNTAPKSILQSIHRAIWECITLEVRYQTFFTQGYQPIHSTIHPYGLIAKATNWYMVARRGDHMLVLGVDRIQEVQLAGGSFDRPDDFNLVVFWEKWCQEYAYNRSSYPVQARVSPSLFKDIGFFLGDKVQQWGSPDLSGWVPVVLNYEYHDQARADLLRLGSAVEVISPIALRFSIKDYAEQILNTYQG